MRADVSSLPLYDADVDEALGGGPEPPAVREFKEAIERADGLLIVTPEYNWSLPGFIKNAIDWVSRPAFRSPLSGKPTLLMGASGGPAGTGRAQLHLRQVLLATRTPVLIPSLELGFAGEHIDEEGNLDEETEERVQRLMEDLVGEAALASQRVLVHGGCEV